MAPVIIKSAETIIISFERLSIFSIMSEIRRLLELNANDSVPAESNNELERKKRLAYFEDSRASPQSALMPINREVAKPIANQLNKKGTRWFDATNAITEIVNTKLIKVNMLWYLKPFKYVFEYVLTIALKKVTVVHTSNVNPLILK